MLPCRLAVNTRSVDFAFDQLIQLFLPLFVGGFVFGDQDQPTGFGVQTVQQMSVIMSSVPGLAKYLGITTNQNDIEQFKSPVLL